MDKLKQMLEHGIEAEKISHEKLVSILLSEIEHLPEEEKEELYKEFYPIIYGKTLSKDICESWVGSMVAKDRMGNIIHSGEKWTESECEAVGRGLGIEFKQFSIHEFYAVMNMCYCDYFKTATTYNHESDNEFFARLAFDWITDSDAPKEKTYLYYFNVIMA